MDAGGAPLSKADLREDPKQFTIRIGNISLFYTTADIILGFTPPELCKKTYVGGPVLLAVLTERRNRGEASLTQAASRSQE